MVLDMIDPVNGLAASYVAELPDPNETRATLTKPEWIRGKFGFRSGVQFPNNLREVFEPYYAQPTEKGVELAPHILFARCPDDTDSIIRFTNEWGPLHHPPDGQAQSGFNPRIFTNSELSEKHKWSCPQF